MFGPRSYAVVLNASAFGVDGHNKTPPSPSSSSSSAPVFCKSVVRPFLDELVSLLPRHLQNTTTSTTTAAPGAAAASSPTHHPYRPPLRRFSDDDDESLGGRNAPTKDVDESVKMTTMSPFLERSSPEAYFRLLPMERSFQQVVIREISDSIIARQTAAVASLEASDDDDGHSDNAAVGADGSGSKRGVNAALPNEAFLLRMLTATKAAAATRVDRHQQMETNGGGGAEEDDAPLKSLMVICTLQVSDTRLASYFFDIVTRYKVLRIDAGEVRRHPGTLASPFPDPTMLNLDAELWQQLWRQVKRRRQQTTSSSASSPSGVRAVDEADGDDAIEEPAAVDRDALRHYIVADLNQALAQMADRRTRKLAAAGTAGPHSVPTAEEEQLSSILASLGAGPPRGGESSSAARSHALSLACIVAYCRHQVSFTGAFSDDGSVNPLYIALVAMWLLVKVSAADVRKLLSLAAPPSPMSSSKGSAASSSSSLPPSPYLFVLTLLFLRSLVPPEELMSAKYLVLLPQHGTHLHHTSRGGGATAAASGAAAAGRDAGAAAAAAEGFRRLRHEVIGPFLNSETRVAVTSDASVTVTVAQAVSQILLGDEHGESWLPRYWKSTSDALRHALEIARQEELAAAQLADDQGRVDEMGVASSVGAAAPQPHATSSSATSFSRCLLPGFSNVADMARFLQSLPIVSAGAVVADATTSTGGGSTGRTSQFESMNSRKGADAQLRPHFVAPEASEVLEQQGPARLMGRRAQRLIDAQRDRREITARTEQAAAKRSAQYFGERGSAITDASTFLSSAVSSSSSDLLTGSDGSTSVVSKRLREGKDVALEVGNSRAATGGGGHTLTMQLPYYGLVTDDDAFVKVAMMTMTEESPYYIQPAVLTLGGAEGAKGGSGRPMGDFGGGDLKVDPVTGIASWTPASTGSGLQRQRRELLRRQLRPSLTTGKPVSSSLVALKHQRGGDAAADRKLPTADRARANRAMCQAAENDDDDFGWRLIF